MKPYFSFSLWILPLIASQALLIQGCSTLVGNVRPVDEKSQTYGILDLSRHNSEWEHLPSASTEAQRAQSKAEEEGNDPLSATEIADVAYQSKKTASIISLNSACRRPLHPEAQPIHELRGITNQLFLGFTGISLRNEREVQFLGRPALETLLQGRLNDGEMKVKAIVLRRGACVYEMVYLALPKFFDLHEKDFHQFIDSLRLKE